MKKVRSLFGLIARRPYISGAVFFALAVAVFAFAGGNGNGYETLTVTKGEFVRQVSVAGKVVPANEVNLAFSETGRIQSLQVAVGDRVAQGAVLATLSLDVLRASLRTAEAELEKIQKEQDTLVGSALRKLHSSGLVAVPEFSNYPADAPEVTGLYEGPAGTYKILIRREEIHEDESMRTFGLETTGPIAIEKGEPTALGTRGLYLTFPDAIELYRNTTWYVTVPNPKSAVYLANFNAYEEALRTRESAVTAAQNKVEEIRADIAERMLRAPFSGTVTAVETEVGAAVSPNETVISLIGGDVLQIESFVPEVNIAAIKVGDSARITLDAYGRETTFDAVIISIDPAETLRDGVSTYKTTLQFKEKDERVRPGMTANIVIETERTQDALVVPQGALIRRGADTFVRVLVDEKTVEERPVVVGGTSLGQAEILAGLASGDTIVLNQF